MVPLTLPPKANACRSAMGFLMFLLLLGAPHYSSAGGAGGCVLPPDAATDAALLSNSTYLRELFSVYGDSERLSLDGLVKLLENLGLIQDPLMEAVNSSLDKSTHDDDQHRQSNSSNGQMSISKAVCGTVQQALPRLSLPSTPSVSPLQLYGVCPALLHYLLISRTPDCSINDTTSSSSMHDVKLLPVLDRRQPHDTRDHHHSGHDHAGHDHSGHDHGRGSSDYDPRDSRYGPRNPGFDARAPPPYDSRNPGYDPSYNPAHDPRNPAYGRGMPPPPLPPYNPRNPGYDPHTVDHNRRVHPPMYDKRGHELPPFNPLNPGYDPRGNIARSNKDLAHGTRIKPKNGKGNLWTPGAVEQAFDGDRKRPLPPTPPPEERILDHPEDQLYGGGTKIDNSRLKKYNRGDPEFIDEQNYEDRRRQWDVQESPYAQWVGGFVSMIVIGCISLACTMILPALRKTRHYDQANHFLLSLAVGTLAGDALIHLLPHAISMGEGDRFARSDHNDHDLSLHEHHGSHHFRQALYGFTALMGIIIFLFLERLHNIRGKGHGHSHGPRGESPTAQDRHSTMPRNATILLSDSHLDVMGLPPSQKIGKKLSEHSKEDIVNASDPSRCFGGCPKNQPTIGAGDANGNNDGLDTASVNIVMGGAGPMMDHGSRSTQSTLRRDQVLTVRRQPLKDGGSTMTLDQAERERLMNPMMMAEKLGGMTDHHSEKKEDSNSVNIVLQEYHVSHHGHSHHGHAHVSGRKDSLRMMILMGEAMHIIMDGMAIGAAFATSLTGGIATAIAVLCHEIPHKVGDFALLFDMGMTRKRAIHVVVFMWLMSVGGMIAGELVGSIEYASPWIYSFTAGIFLHLALVDLLSEVSVKGAETCSAAGQILLQVCGMMLGSAIMLLIALYEHDLHNLLAGSI